tara:strand:- start:761 stop:1549 length:789 start_codon:yes stop_codon:yes gene_type:complete
LKRDHRLRLTKIEHDLIKSVRKNEDEIILILSDLHIPYQHQDSILFLQAVKEHYNIDDKNPNHHIWNSGDEADFAGISYHEKEQSLDNQHTETLKARKIFQELEELFPNMILVHSNHGSMLYRRGKTAGIPNYMLRDYNEVLGVGKGWKWYADYKFKMNNGQWVFMTHGMKKNGLALAKEMGMCVIQGHYHTEFNITYTSNPMTLNWSMMVGCLIDDDSRAFAYNKVNSARVILGCGIIINGQPKLIPMVLEKGGRWNGQVN